MVLLEHPTVVTVPRRSAAKNLLLSKELLRGKGAELVATDRGGEVTLHNPGQLVGYLICKLQPGGRDLHSFLRWIEQRLADVAKSFGVDAHSRKGLTGLWVEDRKIASIGIAVKRWTTLHGFALNVNNDLEPFNWIVPCGLSGVRMTSLAVERGHAILWPRLLEETCAEFRAEWADPRVIMLGNT
jgi:lipoate-protein ligase B